MFQVDRDQVFEKLTGVVAKSLKLKGKKINLQSRLEKDLGAKPIDVAELIMDVEEEFGIPEGNPSFDALITALLEDLDPHIYGNTYGEDRVNKAGVARVKEMIPWADISAFEKDPRLSKVGELLTVKLLVDYIIHYLGKPASCQPQQS